MNCMGDLWYLIIWIFRIISLPLISKTYRLTYWMVGLTPGINTPINNFLSICLFVIPSLKKLDIRKMSFKNKVRKNIYARFIMDLNTHYLIICWSIHQSIETYLTPYYHRIITRPILDIFVLFVYFFLRVIQTKTYPFQFIAFLHFFYFFFPPFLPCSAWRLREVFMHHLLCLFRFSMCHLTATIESLDVASRMLETSSCLFNTNLISDIT